MEKGCSLMEEYNICITGASEDCVPDAGVQAWREVRFFHLFISHRKTFSSNEDLFVVLLLLNFKFSFFSANSSTMLSEG